MAFDLDDLTMCFAGFRVDPMQCDEAGLVELIDAGTAHGFRGASIWAAIVEPLARDGLSHKAMARSEKPVGLGVLSSGTRKFSSSSRSMGSGVVIRAIIEASGVRRQLRFQRRQNSWSVPQVWRWFPSMAYADPGTRTDA